MAKKVTDNDMAAPAAAAPMSAPVAGEPDGVPETEETTPEGTPTPPTSPDTVPEYAGRLLQVFRGYDKLYIDRLGGTYTADTPPVFCTDATLYTNPYHKP
ncbi:hypothetical protein [Alistipes sp. i18-0019-D1]|uniref:hypothetical protein n=1 Tax=Alistipes sp. i18-0019-D1 TaxID=3132707 RepID=UPI0036F21A69